MVGVDHKNLPLHSVCRSIQHIYGAPAMCWALSCKIQIRQEEMIHQKEFWKALKKGPYGWKGEKKDKTNSSKEETYPMWQNKTRKKISD